MNEIIREKFMEKIRNFRCYISEFWEIALSKACWTCRKTALIVIDMNNGFARGGALYSPRIEALIPEVSRIAEAFAKETSIPLIFVNEDHSKDAREFLSYPAHCVRGTKEIEIIDELKDIENKILIGKNYTNAFAVDTYDLDIVNHNGDLMNVVFLYSMLGNGMEVVVGID